MAELCFELKGGTHSVSVFTNGLTSISSPWRFLTVPNHFLPKSFAPITSVGPAKLLCVSKKKNSLPGCGAKRSKEDLEVVPTAAGIKTGVEAAGAGLMGALKSSSMSESSSRSSPARSENPVAAMHIHHQCHCFTTNAIENRGPECRHSHSSALGANMSFKVCCFVSCF
jgi:hypothetical protein